MVDPDAPEPAYVQLAGILRARIASGEITARLPSERTIQQETGLSPMTIRKAIRILRDEGLVVTVTGRGTFVKR